MDEKQAIVRIRKLLDSPLRETSLSPRIVKALEYAIKALKKQIYEVPAEMPPRRQAGDRWPVGGIDRSGEVDRIDIQAALETPFWMAVWATEPEREVDVRMSYSDLKTLIDCFDNVRKFLGKGEGNAKA